MNTVNTDNKLSPLGKFLTEMVVVIIIAVGGVSLISYASLSDLEPRQLADTADDYWTGQSTSSTAAVSGEQVRTYPAVPPQTLENKADQLESFVGVDLQAMQLYLYENGSVAHTYPVLAKGQPESRQETPSGQYEISYQNERHLSSAGDVYLPYSQQFYGNFSIHGWPYYPDGTEVEESYSGGGIRLSNTDAKALFERTNAGTPVVVVGNEASGEVAITQPENPVPTVNAKAYIVADIETGHVFAQKQANQKMPIASISKLMTAVVANETIAYNDPITVSQQAVATYGLAGGLTAGESLRLETLYYPLLLESSNDAATAIAEHHGPNRFMDLMNSKAEALDMDSTYFKDPSGLSDENTSSVRDLFRLTRYIHNRKKFVFDLTATTFQTTPDRYSDGLRNFTNNNPMAGRDDFIGGKNGYTNNARHTLLSVFSVDIDGVEHKVTIIVLGSETHAKDTTKLLSWLKQAT